jgi:transcriptional regulator with XRE-family HTH domain
VRKKEGGQSMENQQNPGKTIKRIRLSKGVTATFMAKQLGYKAVSSYIRLENGESPITLENAKLIADLLSVDMNIFFENSLREMHN